MDLPVWLDEWLNEAHSITGKSAAGQELELSEFWLTHADQAVEQIRTMLENTPEDPKKALKH